jgi:hypothetical protein
MTRILLRSRRVMAVSILVLLAGVVVLSAATRKPCLHACTGPWHVWKAGHMTKTEGLEVRGLRVTAEVLAPEVAPQDSPLPTIYLPHEDRTPPANSIVIQIRNFRSPPFLG